MLQHFYLRPCFNADQLHNKSKSQNGFFLDIFVSFCHEDVHLARSLSASARPALRATSRPVSARPVIIIPSRQRPSQRLRSSSSARGLDAPNPESSDLKRVVNGYNRYFLSAAAQGMDSTANEPVNNTLAADSILPTASDLFSAHPVNPTPPNATSHNITSVALSLAPARPASATPTSSHHPRSSFGKFPVSPSGVNIDALALRGLFYGETTSNASLLVRDCDQQSPGPPWHGGLNMLDERHNISNSSSAGRHPLVSVSAVKIITIR
jgi:hypothetical protein